MHAELRFARQSTDQPSWSATLPAAPSGMGDTMPVHAIRQLPKTHFHHRTEISGPLELRRPFDTTLGRST